jgi:23S rRNA-/tRNA-specific pseudouridylate synthase
LAHQRQNSRLASKRQPVARRLALHASSISFTHPFNGRMLHFATGLPDDFARLLGEPLNR